MMNTLRLERFKEAKAIVDKVVYRTRLIKSPYFSALYNCEVYFKPENIQLTGAYKIRGALYRISQLTDEERKHGLIAASAGNHAQGVALAAQMHGLKVYIVMPTTTPLMKVNNTKAYGAEVILYGASYDEACEHAIELAKEQGFTFIHPFDDLGVATGQGTMVFEILEDEPEIDTILVPVGGGGLATGVSVLTHMLSPNVRVIGVEPEGAACLKAALDAGEPVTLPSTTTIADGVAVKRIGEKLFPYLQKNIDAVAEVPDEELVGVFLDMLERHKMLVENAGLLSVAALKHIDIKAGSKVCCILSGGNMDVITIASLVQHGLINRDRVFTFSVLLPDRPGELEHIAHIVAKERGNIIRLEHNQFVSINRNAAVELKVTLEAFGTAHKQHIFAALKAEGYHAEQVGSSVVY